MKTVHEYPADSIIYRINKNEIEFLLVQNMLNCTWGFPKGHLEAGENNVQAAKREVYGEVGLRPNYNFNFKKSLTYKTTRDRSKTVTLLLSGFISTQRVKLRKSEIGASRWASLEGANKCLHYEELNEAQDYIKNEISR